MTAATIAIMIGALLLLLIVVNAIDQYKQKVSVERHRRLMKLAAITHETEELLVNGVQLPMSNTLIGVLLQRNLDVLEQMKTLMPDSSKVPERLEDTRSQLADVDTTNKERPALMIPNSDEHTAALIKTIKKVRFILTKQKRRGNLSSADFSREDAALESDMLKVFVEYKIKQGNAAKHQDKLGTARQFFEKALKSLKSQSLNSDYVSQKTLEVNAKLDDIAELLKRNGPLEEVPTTAEEDEEDFGSLFAQDKKKW
ncbi:MAG: hypothetical protein HRT35_22180 [Algicola sp.]|nr:hypothetical protein [Algicola sp.]